MSVWDGEGSDSAEPGTFAGGAGGTGTIARGRGGPGGVGGTTQSSEPVPVGGRPR